jgi:glucose-1-phosphate cytidylyltransferase
LRQGGLFDVVAHGRVLVECRRRKIGRVIAYSQRETIAADILLMGPVTGVPDYSTGENRCGGRMKAVILAGGFGTRLGEETALKPKPMVEVGGRPILWHIMKIYSEHGILDFVVCLGYKGYVIKEYFANYLLHSSDVTVDLRQNTLEFDNERAEPWRVSLVETGHGTLTGGRLLRIAKYLGGEEFCLTYGDGVADVNITELIAMHREHGRLATVTATRTPGRFGLLQIDGQQVTRFEEKPRGEGGWVNGGFFVLSPGFEAYIDGDKTAWEREPLERLARDDQLMAFRHEGFWHPMDTMRDRNYLEALWRDGQAPWKIWT